MCAIHRLLWRCHKLELTLVNLDIVVLELCDGILDLHLGIVDEEIRPILHEHVADSECWGLTAVIRISLNANPNMVIFIFTGVLKSIQIW